MKSKREGKRRNNTQIRGKKRAVSQGFVLIQNLEEKKKEGNSMKQSILTLLVVLCTPQDCATASLVRVSLKIMCQWRCFPTNTRFRREIPRNENINRRILTRGEEETERLGACAAQVSTRRPRKKNSTKSCVSERCQQLSVTTAGGPLASKAFFEC